MRKKRAMIPAVDPTRGSILSFFPVPSLFKGMTRPLMQLSAEKQVKQKWTHFWNG
jgi:hypothetical protein